MIAKSAPDDRRYSPDHVWLDGEGYVGVTPWLLEVIGAIDRVHLPARGSELFVAQAFGALEGSKGLVDLYAPCDGAAEDVNASVLDDAELIRREPYAGGWLLHLSRYDSSALWSAEQYRAQMRAPARPRRERS